MVTTKRTAAVIGAVLAVGAVGGCSIGGGDTYQGIEVPGRGVTVQASGTVRVVPDAVAFSFSVSERADSNDAAVSAVSAMADSARTALEDADVDSDDIASRSVTVVPEYEYPASGAPVLLGYRATQSFSVTLRDAGAAGETVQGVVRAVGDGLTVESVAPTVLDLAEATERARTAAVEQATKKARDYAGLFDAELGELQSVSELSSPVVMADAKVSAAPEMAVDAPLVIDLGTSEVTVSIEARWSLKD
jgi:uncharacterized protein YggE